MTDCRACVHYAPLHGDWCGLCQWEPEPLPDLPRPPIRGPVRAVSAAEVVNVYCGEDPTVTDCPVFRQRLR